MNTSKKHDSNETTNVLFIWREGDARAYLKNVDVKVLKDGVIQINNPAKNEILTTHISNVLIISEMTS